MISHDLSIYQECGNFLWNQVLIILTKNISPRVSLKLHQNPIAYKTSWYHKYPSKLSLDCILKPTWNLRVSSEAILIMIYIFKLYRFLELGGNSLLLDAEVRQATPLSIRRAAHLNSSPQTGLSPTAQPFDANMSDTLRYIIKRGNGKSHVNGGFNGKIIHQWWIFHCHVWLPEGIVSSDQSWSIQLYPSPPMPTFQPMKLPPSQMFPTCSDSCRPVTKS